MMVMMIMVMMMITNTNHSLLFLQIDNLVKDLVTLGECTLQTDRAIVSIIGEGMKHRVSRDWSSQQL